MKPKSQIEKRMDGMDDYGGGTGGNLVVIRNSGLPEYLKSYTLIKPKTVDKPVICDVRNPITVNGITMYENGSTAPNGVKIGTIYTADDLSKIPDVPTYTGAIPFNTPSFYKAGSQGYLYIRGIKGFLPDEYGSYTYYLDAYSAETGQSVDFGLPTSLNITDLAAAFAYNRIYAPGTAEISYIYEPFIYEYGYATASIYLKWFNTKSNKWTFSSNLSIPIPFASIEEYNAAMVFATAAQNMAALEKVQ